MFILSRPCAGHLPQGRGYHWRGGARGARLAAMKRFAISYLLVLSLLLAGQITSLARGGGMTDVVMVLCGGEGIVPMPGDERAHLPCDDCVMVAGLAVLPEVLAMVAPGASRDRAYALPVAQGYVDLGLAPVARGPPVAPS